MQHVKRGAILDMRNVVKCVATCSSHLWMLDISWTELLSYDNNSSEISGALWHLLVLCCVFPAGPTNHIITTIKTVAVLPGGSSLDQGGCCWRGYSFCSRGTRLNPDKSCLASNFELFSLTIITHCHFRKWSSLEKNRKEIVAEFFLIEETLYW